VANKTETTVIILLYNIVENNFEKWINVYEKRIELIIIVQYQAI